MEKGKNDGQGFISNSEEDIKYIVNIKLKHQTKFSTILEPFEECENFDKYISYLDSVRLKSLQKTIIEQNSIQQKIIERNNDNDFLVVHSRLSDAVTQHKGCGREIKNHESKPFRLKNKKFSLTFNGIILDKTQIVQYFEVNKSKRPKGLIEGMKDYVVAHEYGQNNKHTHIMFYFANSIDSSNSKNLSIFTEYKGKMETFEPVVHTQGTELERKTMLQIFHRIDKQVYYSFPAKYNIENYQYNSDTLLTDLTCENSLGAQNMEISINSSFSNSTTPISSSLINPLPINSSTMSSCQSNSLQSTSLQLTLSKFKMPIFNKQWQNDLLKEMEESMQKNICYFPKTEDDDLDNKISEIIVHLKSGVDKKKYYVITLYQNREKLFDGIIKNITSKEWSGNTLFVYFNHDDYSSSNLYEELYKNLIKDLKKIKTRVITTIECQTPTVLSQTPNIILIITKKMEKIGSESDWIYHEIN